MPIDIEATKATDTTPAQVVVTDRDPMARRPPTFAIPFDDWADVDVFVTRLYLAASDAFGDPELPLSSPLYFRNRNRAGRNPRPR
jgi:hypothetical protein